MPPAPPLPPLAAPPLAGGTGGSVGHIGPGLSRVPTIAVSLWISGTQVFAQVERANGRST
jgi:hypothetical protein